MVNGSAHILAVLNGICLGGVSATCNARGVLTNRTIALFVMEDHLLSRSNAVVAGRQLPTTNILSNRTDAGRNGARSVSICI